MLDELPRHYCLNGAIKTLYFVCCDHFRSVCAKGVSIVYKEGRHSGGTESTAWQSIYLAAALMMHILKGGLVYGTYTCYQPMACQALR
jgi:hypothetical protein